LRPFKAALGEDMSIVRSLIWLFDQNEEREEKAEEERWRKQFDPSAPDDGPDPPSLEVKQDGRQYRCRCCGRMEREAKYCPDCLADTLVPW